MSGEAVHPDMSHRHIDVGGKDCDQQEGEAPPRQKLNPSHRNQEADTSEKLEDAADENAGQMEGNPGRHDRQKQGRIEEMEAPGHQKKRGEKEPDSVAENRDEKFGHK
jgi:hypothetical protein